MEPKEAFVDGDGVLPHERKEVFVDGDGVLHIPTRCSTSNLLPTHSPAAVVASGAEVVFHTSDYAYERLSKRDGLQDQPPLTLEEINIVTGPLAVEGAMPGDALRVEILDVKIRRCWSVWMAEAAVSGCLACKLAATGRESSVRQLSIDNVNQTVHISQRLHVPLEPMIGVIATAPSLDNKSQSSTFEPTYSHGGNMDLREMQKGAAILLPIQIEGGLLFIGDLHACMARGEATWVGFEAAGAARVRVTLLKGAAPPFPRLFVDGSTIFTAVTSLHTKSLDLVLEQAYEHLLTEEGGGLTPDEAHGFCTAQLEMRLGGPASQQMLGVLPDVRRFLREE